MNTLIKIIENTDGDKQEPVWHLFFHQGGGDKSVFCTGEFVDLCIYKTKTVKRGGITCQDCLRKIKEIKAIQL